LQLGVTLRNARLKAGLSQDELGELAGVSRQLVSRVEAGNPRGEIGRVAQIAAALGYRLSAAPRTSHAPSRDQQAVNELIGRLQGDITSNGRLQGDITSIRGSTQDDRD